MSASMGLLTQRWRNQEPRIEWTGAIYSGTFLNYTSHGSAAQYETITMRILLWMNNLDRNQGSKKHL